MSHKCRRDGNKYLQNVNLSGEQQSTFLAPQSRFNLECFIYFIPLERKKGKKKEQSKSGLYKPVHCNYVNED
jgi:hypothetical protein